MVEKIREIKQSTALGQNPMGAFAAADQLMQQKDKFLNFLRLKGRRGGNQMRDDALDPAQLRNSVPGGDFASSRISSFLRIGASLAASLANSSNVNSANGQVDMLSPRFLSLFPEDENDGMHGERGGGSQQQATPVNFLSPSVFSLHDKGKGLEREMSLPSLLKGFGQRDRQEWLNFIVQASGVGDQMEKVKALISNDNDSDNAGESNKILSSDLKSGIPDELKAMAESFGRETVIRGRVQKDSPLNDAEIKSTLSVEQKKAALWDRLCASYTPQQLRELDTTGITMLNTRQLR
jgi:hypothetical protein